MMRRNVFTLQILLSSALFVASCKPTEFQSYKRPEGQNTKAAAKAKMDAQTLLVSCEQEKSGSVALKTRDTNVISFTKDCLSEGKSEKNPTDIVFAIDVTRSMQDSLNTVKNGVVRFAQRLRQDKGWDARFAAVGFRDRVEEKIAFTDENSLANAMMSWESYGGGDIQEAGQAGIAEALDLHLSDMLSNRSRAEAGKIILFIGDAAGFALNGNHSDLSTTELARIINSASASFKSRFRFYHSSATEVPSCEVMTLFGCSRVGLSPALAAHPQMTALAQTLGLNGRSFDFPFTETIMLSEFVDEFLPAKSCLLKAAVARDASGTELAKAESNTALTLPAGYKGTEFNIDLERCCATPSAPSDPKSSCISSSTKMQVKLP